MYINVRFHLAKLITAITHTLNPPMFGVDPPRSLRPDPPGSRKCLYEHPNLLLTLEDRLKE